MVSLKTFKQDFSGGQAFMNPIYLVDRCPHTEFCCWFSGDGFDFNPQCLSHNYHMNGVSIELL